MAGPSRLLDILPAEMRNAIYEVCIAQQQPTAVELIGSSIRPANPPPIALTCKTIRKEFLSLWRSATPSLHSLSNSTACERLDLSKTVKIRARVFDLHFSDLSLFIGHVMQASSLATLRRIGIHLVMTRASIALGEKAAEQALESLRGFLDIRDGRAESCLRFDWGQSGNMGGVVVDYTAELRCPSTRFDGSRLAAKFAAMTDPKLLPIRGALEEAARKQEVGV